MPTLLVPDIHERLDKLTVALNTYAHKADRIVFLGDWFDSFGPVDLDRLRQVCHFVNEHIDGYRQDDGTVIPATFLLGNHDCHYFFSNHSFKCSGYMPIKDELINSMITPEVKQKFKIYTTAGDYVLSHAGFHPDTLQWMSPEVEQGALDKAYRGEFSQVFGAGRARGGDNLIGGPTWLDFNYEFEHIPSLPQIVGHTHGSAIRTKGPTGDEPMSWCLDCGLKFVAFVDGREVKVEGV